MNRFDTRTTTFSPEGRLYQVEYALEAINNASSTVGIVTKEGVVMAADKMVPSKLLDQSVEKEKIYVVDKQMVCAVAGWTADANVLLQQARVTCQRYRYRFGEPMPLQDLVIQICDTKQSYTQFGGLRPFGVSFLMAGYDPIQKFQLFNTDPAGNYGGWKATAVGQNSVSAQGILKQEWNENLTLEDGFELAAKVLLQTTDAASPNSEMTEFAVLELVDGIPRHRFLTTEETAALLAKAAQNKITVAEE